MMTKVVKRLQDFDAAHRLLNYDGKCKNLHGHTYGVEVEYNNYDKRQLYPLNNLGMVKDFGDFKVISDWIQQNWDHATIINNEDRSLIDWCEAEHNKHYIINGNPTAENMCLEVLIQFEWITKIRIWETKTSYAEANNE